MTQSALRGADHAHFNRRLRERWLALREEIRDTLLRADAESYADVSHAEVCDKSIDRERLEAYPTAKRCLPCQQLHERTRPQMQGPTL